MKKRFQELLKEYDTTKSLPIAMADITFKFPKSCLYPCLNINMDFGLVSPLGGRTVATLPEIHLALYLGATIQYHEVVVIETGDKYLFKEHLHELITLRAEAKETDQELLQQLYKTYANSLYGKLAQGIRDRKMFSTRDGTTKPLPKSKITNPYFASMTTGLIRAALSEMLVAIQELIDEGYDYKIISATTDGLLYGVNPDIVPEENLFNIDELSKQYETIAEALKAGYKKFQPFGKVDPLLYERLMTFPSLRLLKYSHELWDDDTFIEIKHMANTVTNVKTRGQIGLYKTDVETICTLLAKAGHKVPGDKDEQAQWMLDHYDDPDIQIYKYTRLSNIQAILDENDPIEDLVSVHEERKISLDYDYKRKPVNANDTVAHSDVDEFTKYRQSCNYVRRLGRRATVNAVEYKHHLAEQGVRKVGSNKEYCARHVIRALMNEVKPFKKLNMTYGELARLLNEFKVNISKVKRAKKEIFSPYTVSDTTANRACIRKILRLLGYQTRTNYKNFLELLLHKDISNPEDVKYLD